MKRFLLSLALLLCLPSLCTAAEGPDDVAKALDLVHRAYSSVGSIRAVFVQSEERPGVGVTDREKGVLSFLLPDRMRWDYLGEKPHRVVIDDDLVWIYSPSRRQVIRRRMTAEEMRLGAATFLRGLDGLEDDFTIQSGRVRPAGRYALELFPVREATPYEKIGILVSPETGIIERITIFHRIGNITTITFSEIETGVDLPQELFLWDVPEGTEVIEP